MSDLFPIEETLSPRLKWMRENDIDAQECEIHGYSFDRLVTRPQWVAWSKRKATKAVARYEFGDTEDDAIVGLAKKLAIPLWNEPTRPL